MTAYDVAMEIVQDLPQGQGFGQGKMIEMKLIKFRRFVLEESAQRLRDLDRPIREGVLFHATTKVACADVLEAWARGVEI